MEQNHNTAATAKKRHPRALAPSMLIVNILIAILCAIIGLELITRLGISTNTSIFGALFAILISKIPFKLFNRFRNLNSQNLIQTAASGATTSAANSIFLPLGIAWVMGRNDLVIPLLIGVSVAAITDATIIYNLFDTEIFPASNSWAQGIGTAETLLAASKKGKSSFMLLGGMAMGVVGKMVGLSTDLLGVAWIGNIFALTAFGVGLLIREFIPVNIDAMYIPHGIMIGAGMVSLIQMGIALAKSRKQKAADKSRTRTGKDIRNGFLFGSLAYLGIAAFLAVATGLYTQMSILMLIGWIFFAMVAAFASELIVGMSAMHSGWFPAFATALIFLIVGMLFGFPPTALAVLVGFTAATGPCFSDMAYDFKTGWIIRGKGEDPEFEREGRKQQFIAEMVSFGVAIIVVAIAHGFYFRQDLVAPTVRVYWTTIEAGASLSVAKSLLLWAIPGAIIQAVGGSSRQLGLLFATGLLIYTPTAGITVLAAILIRIIVVKRFGARGQNTLYILGAGSIAGAALYSFFTSTIKIVDRK